MKSRNAFDIAEECSGMKLGRYLRERLLLSRNAVIRIKKSGTLTVNGLIAHTDRLLKVGDRVEFELTDENSTNILPEQMELDIVYEDEYMLVINKVAGIPTHPSGRHQTGTLANGLVFYLNSRGAELTARPVNRLDRNTSGLVAFAKNSHVQHLLNLEAYKGRMIKEYLAVVHGRVTGSQGTIDAPIAREKEHSVVRVVREDGSRAITHYRVIERYRDSALLSLILETGRTHQIRVHMAYLGHPLLGDDLYGGSLERIKRQALHASSIKMLHPITHADMEFSAELPEDMRELITICSSV
ncbi:MAG TPA: RluA family pseudouridine synthase [Clostridia bacterium]|nr:RluA family pseudouridine synthase [Clostridia bacterium]